MSERIFLGLESLVERGIITQQQAEQIIEGVKAKENFIIAGSTGSGKTAIAVAIAKEIRTHFTNIPMYEVGEPLEVADNDITKPLSHINPIEVKDVKQRAQEEECYMYVSETGSRQINMQDVGKHFVLEVHASMQLASFSEQELKTKYFDLIQDNTLNIIFMERRCNKVPFAARVVKIK